MSQAAGDHMISRKSGKIINIASMNSFVGGENHAPYSASKGGVAQLTKALSNEWAKTQCPGKYYCAWICGD